MLAAEDEASLNQMRNHHDAFGAFHYFFRYALIGSGGDLLENIRGILQTLGCGLKGRCHCEISHYRCQT